MAKQLVEQQGWTFTAHTQTNPMEHCKVVTTQRGRVIETWVGENFEKERVIVESREKQDA